MPHFHHDFAAKHTRLTLEETRTLENGESVRVYGFIATNNTGSAVNIEIIDATKPAGQPHFYIADVSLPANTTLESQSRWLADHGVKVMSVNAGVSISFFHSHGGA